MNEIMTNKRKRQIKRFIDKYSDELRELSEEWESLSDVREIAWWRENIIKYESAKKIIRLAREEMGYETSNGRWLLLMLISKWQNKKWLKDNLNVLHDEVGRCSELDFRMVGLLWSNGIQKWEDMSNVSEIELKRRRGVGSVMMKAIKKQMKLRGIKFKS
jgi:hypothetical protein